MAERLPQGGVKNYSKNFREKFWMKLLGGPQVLAPLLAGSSCLMVNWALELHSGVAAFLGVCGLLVSAGVILTKFLTGGPQIGSEIATEIAEEIEQQQQAELDALEKDLKKDGDPGTEAALADLRKLSEAFSCESLWPEGVNTASRRDITQNVSKLFNSCVALLRQSLELWNIASEINVETAREPLLQRRQKMLEDVAEGIGQLGGVLAGLHEIRVSEDGDGKMVRDLSDQLEQSMQVAKAAESRIAGIEREIEERV